MSIHTFKQLQALADDCGMGHELLEGFAFACRVKNLTDSTLKCYAERLAYLVKFATSKQKQLDELTTKDIQAYMMSIVDSVSAATVNGRIRVFRVFYRYLESEGLISSNPMTSIKLIRGEQRIKQVLSPEQIASLLSKLNRREFHGARDYLMILVTYDAMLRLKELLTLKISDVDLNARLAKVYGKGRKERFVPFSDKTATTIHTYLIKHRRGISGDLLFPMQDGRELTLRRAHRIFTNPGRKAGIYVHPHLVRHSSASQFIRMGGNPSILQKILGHSSVKTTWDVYGTESLADVRRNYANTAEQIYRIKRRR